MERAQKEKFVQALHGDLMKAKITYVAKFQGITVAQVTDVRDKLREKGAKYKVVKNTLARIALKGTQFEELKDKIKEPLAFIYSDTDPVGPTKVLKEFEKDETLPLKIIYGHMDGRLLKAEEIKALSQLPSREELLAKMMGSMKAPAQNFVNVMAAVPRQLVTVLAAIRDQKQKG